MKINKAKLLVGTLAIASVAATVGSISGTVAWFQYSTRSTVEYSAATAHCTENLQIRLYDSALIGDSKKPYANDTAWDGDFPWSADLTPSMIENYIKVKRGEWKEATTDPEAPAQWKNSEDTNLYPVTSGALASGVAATSFWTNPIYQYSGAYTTPGWKAATVADYVELPIQLRVLDRNGANPDKFLAGKKIYLSDLTLNSSATGTKKDVTKALRVSFDATNEVTFSVDGGNTAVSGNLDLNADGLYDYPEGYSWQRTTETEPFLYGGTGSPVAVSSPLTKATESALTYLANDADPYKIIGNALGVTAGDSPMLSVTVRIYLEGWQALADSTIKAKPDETGTATDMKTLWDDDLFVGSTFHIGMRFSAEAHTDHA